MLKEKIFDDMKQAMKAKDTERLNVLRLLRGQIRQVEIDGQKELNDDETLKVLSKAAKQRKDSIASFKQGGRDDLAEKESAELAVIQEYLPKEMNDEELEKIVSEVIAQTGASSMKDMGKVMGMAMGKTAGRADGGRVQAIVRAKLS